MQLLGQEQKGNKQLTFIFCLIYHMHKTETPLCYNSSKPHLIIVNRRKLCNRHPSSSHPNLTPSQKRLKSSKKSTEVSIHQNFVAGKKICLIHNVDTTETPLNYNQSKNIMQSSPHQLTPGSNTIPLNYENL